MPGAPLPAAVAVREVGPRDGLQSERPLAPIERAELVLALGRAGCRRIEAVSFVSETAVPAMGGAAEVLEAVHAGLSGAEESPVRLTALVPNKRGADAALEAGCDELSVTVAASPTYNQKNVRRGIDESVAEIGDICHAAGTAALPVDAVVSCAFGSPYEGEEISPQFVAELSRMLVSIGCNAITLADTTGVANPVILEQVLDMVRQAVPGVDIGLHLHETRGTALLNAYVALELGVLRFDSSVGGLGGSPFAEGAGGNLSTEDFVSLLAGLGIDTGIELESLLEIAAGLPELVGHEIKSKVRMKS